MNKTNWLGHVKVFCKSRRMTANGANPKRDSVRVAAAIRGGADSSSPRWPAHSGVPRPRGHVDQGARLPGAVVRRERCNRGYGGRWLDYQAARCPIPSPDDGSLDVLELLIPTLCAERSHRSNGE
jgi:hypothetical protein